MIIGECPYCDQMVSTNIHPKIGAWTKEKCPSCEKEYFLKHSRFEPIAYPLENITYDEITKKITGVKNV